MAWPYSQIKTAVTGDILTATDYNNEHQNHITNNDPTAINDDSPTVVQMKVTVDPGESGTESLATTLQGEIERLRFAIVDMKGTSFWYQTPTKTLAQMLPLAGGTMSGAIAMGASKVTGLAAASANGDAIRYEQVFNAAGYAIGTIVQSIQLVNATSTTSSGTGQTATNLSQAIVPKATTHKIRITVTGTLNLTGGSFASATIARGGSNLSGHTGFAINLITGVIPCSMCFLDSPASTSSQTYAVYISSSTAASAIWNNATIDAVMLLEEIAF